MPWFLALWAMRRRLPPLEWLTYQIHIPSPLYGLPDPPPLPPVPVPPEAAPPLAAPATAPMASVTASIPAATPARALWRERERLLGRLPNGPRMNLGACICAPAAQ